MKDKKLEVSAIENGTVIDHIPANVLFKVISILNLNKFDKQITFGTNLESKKLGKKAIIKLSDTFFIDKEINKIALVAPQAREGERLCGAALIVLDDEGDGAEPDLPRHHPRHGPGPGPGPRIGCCEGCSSSRAGWR